ncbi:nucleoside 2-deoxyribosyltransferase [Paenibacillus hamazuiensis]|uniref:nucleoside 2-deoxyribosyltransferase n=1 Tax=Paenibacillus hamazuiensis TaxID=2936508 RepID=UPI00200F9154|nr:nucleoside 2-deoxyribosyltransferase [Paenibacillus hamazuiensis]
MAPAERYREEDGELYIVIGGVVARCKAMQIEGITHFVRAPYDGKVRAVHREHGDEASIIASFVYRTKEEAQRAILTNAFDPTALKWSGVGEAGVPKIYLAGVHVFRPDAVQYGRELRELCRAYGFEGLYRLDKEPLDNLSGPDTAKMIFYANVGLIRVADILIADLNPFRGYEPDSGTVFECGLGYALNKKLYGFISDGRTMYDKLAHAINPQTGTFKDGMAVENFGLPLNLMLSIPVHLVVGSLEECLKRVRSDLLEDGPVNTV